MNRQNPKVTTDRDQVVYQLTALADRVMGPGTLNKDGATALAERLEQAVERAIARQQDGKPELPQR